MNWLCSYQYGYQILFHKLVELGYTEILNFFLLSPKGTEWINLPDKDTGNTPLAIAINSANITLALTLIQYGATFNFKTNDDENIYHLLAKMNPPSNISQSKLICSFFEKMKESNLSNEVDINAKNSQGLTPIQICLNNKNALVANNLIINGASISPEIKTDLEELLSSLTTSQISLFTLKDEETQTKKSFRDSFFSLFSKDESEDSKTKSLKDSMLEDINKITIKPYIDYVFLFINYAFSVLIQ